MVVPPEQAASSSEQVISEPEHSSYTAIRVSKAAWLQVETTRPLSASAVWLNQTSSTRLSPEVLVAHSPISGGPSVEQFSVVKGCRPSSSGRAWLRESLAGATRSSTARLTHPRPRRAAAVEVGPHTAMQHARSSHPGAPTEPRVPRRRPRGQFPVAATEVVPCRSSWVSSWITMPAPTSSSVPNPPRVIWSTNRRRRPC